jgi:ribosomal protein L11 methylase PrmA
MGIDNANQSFSVSEKAKKRANKITNDPIMADILADTAMTTLQEQKEGSRPSGPSIMSGGDQAAKIVDQQSPESLFGEASSKWANLAFAPSIRK